jgi:agmatinase
MRPSRLVVLPYQIEHQDDERLVVRGTAADARLELGAGFALFLDGFSAPRDVHDFLAEHADRATEDELLDAIDLLLDKGLLVDAAWREALRDLRLAQPAYAAFAFERVSSTTLLTRDGPIDAVFVGVPLDIATTGAAGARGGPAAVRLHLVARPLESGRFVDDSDGRERTVTIDGAVDIGDVVLVPGEGIRAVLPRLHTAAQLAARRGAFLCAVGGDHSITYPLVRGLVAGRRERGEQRKLCVVHFDAHADLPRGPLGGPFDAMYSHASFLRHVIDDGLVDAVVQVGLRCVQPTTSNPVTLAVEPVVVGGARAQSLTPDALLALVPDDHDVYVTVDIDVVDPAFAPDTGTPVPCGMMPGQLAVLLNALADARRLVGVDVAEVAGPASATNRTAALAAHLLHGMLLRRFAR